MQLKEHIAIFWSTLLYFKDGAFMKGLYLPLLCIAFLYSTLLYFTLKNELCVKQAMVRMI